MALPINQLSEHTWTIPKSGAMRVPGIIFASESLVRSMEPETFSQLTDVASMPGIVGSALLMPDGHLGFGMPIGGVAAFDPRQGGVVSAGAVGYDIGCGVRSITTTLSKDEVWAKRETIADALFNAIPTGVGRGGTIRLEGDELDEMLYRGAAWAVDRGKGVARDLEHTEEGGHLRGADPSTVSPAAKGRMLDQLGTLGSGNHYLEIQYVDEILDAGKAEIYGLKPGMVVVSIHCGSRGLGHQVATDYIAEMSGRMGKKKKKKARNLPPGAVLAPNAQLACAAVDSDLGQRYLGAMQAAINTALANRQVITHLARRAFADVFPDAQLHLLYDVSHNTCKAETHVVNGKSMNLYVHRKGATRSFAPGHPAITKTFRDAGQPVLLGGSMGTPSYILAGTQTAMDISFGSAPHGAGRALSRTAAKKRFKGRDIVETLLHRNIYVRTSSFKGVAEEAPDAYKNISEVVSAAAGAGIGVPVARLMPLINIKG